ncbi:MAG TPA: response regulator transcription factor [Anaerohalosphaeraceae bacterium]|jgi:DNA-binding NarL/FixJ family response regulator|nr:response regulator transcription factor [Anaerohalosphaeraceae bacterium]HRT50759.1 response regulator transcription factor [Anaerohalosphaeraceae bacterium]HRT86795.1 response regulator transcription factor [Anaerohalosphaeraceae bacterium]
MAIKMLLVDDHEIMRQGLYMLLEKQPDIEVVGMAHNGRMAMEMARELAPDLIVMDVNMPGLDGVDATRQITATDSKVKIVALSMHAKKGFIVEMLKAGASGYVLKESAFSELIAAINTVLSGEVFLSSKITRIVIDDYVQDRTGGGLQSAPLTERENEVLKLIGDGKSSKEIALLLELSVKTVDACRRRIMAKLNIDSVADLVKYAIREGLTSLEA